MEPMRELRPVFAPQTVGMSPLIPISPEALRLKYKQQLDEQAQVYSLLDPILNQAAHERYADKYGKLGELFAPVFGYAELIKKNTLGYLKSPMQGLMNNLRLLGDTADQIFGASAIKSFIYSKQNKEDVFQNLAKAYGFSSEGRRQFDASDISHSENFWVNFGLELSLDPSTYFTLGAGSALKSSIKNVDDVSLSLVKTMSDDLAAAGGKPVVADALQKRVLKSLYSNDKKGFAKTIANYDTSLKTVKGQSFNKYVDELWSSLKSTGNFEPGPIYKTLHALDEFDGLMARVTLKQTLPGVAYQLIKRNSSKLFNIKAIDEIVETHVDKRIKNQMNIKSSENKLIAESNDPAALYKEYDELLTKIETHDYKSEPDQLIADFKTLGEVYETYETVVKYYGYDNKLTQYYDLLKQLEMYSKYTNLRSNADIKNLIKEFMALIHNDSHLQAIFSSNKHVSDIFKNLKDYVDEDLAKYYNDLLKRYEEQLVHVRQHIPDEVSDVRVKSLNLETMKRADNMAQTTIKDIRMATDNLEKVKHYTELKKQLEQLKKAVPNNVIHELNYKEVSEILSMLDSEDIYKSQIKQLNDKLKFIRKFTSEDALGYISKRDKGITPQLKYFVTNAKEEYDILIKEYQQTKKIFDVLNINNTFTHTPQYDIHNYQIVKQLSEDTGKFSKHLDSMIKTMRDVFLSSDTDTIAEVADRVATSNQKLVDLLDAYYEVARGTAASYKTLKTMKNVMYTPTRLTFEKLQAKYEKYASYHKTLIEKYGYDENLIKFDKDVNDFYNDYLRLEEIHNQNKLKVKKGKLDAEEVHKQFVEGIEQLKKKDKYKFLTLMIEDFPVVHKAQAQIDTEIKLLNYPEQKAARRADELNKQVDDLKKEIEHIKSYNSEPKAMIEKRIAGKERQLLTLDSELTYYNNLKLNTNMYSKHRYDEAIANVYHNIEGANRQYQMDIQKLREGNYKEQQEGLTKRLEEKLAQLEKKTINADRRYIRLVNHNDKLRKELIREKNLMNYIHFGNVIPGFYKLKQGQKVVALNLKDRLYWFTQVSKSMRNRQYFIKEYLLIDRIAGVLGNIVKISDPEQIGDFSLKEIRALQKEVLNVRGSLEFQAKEMYKAFDHNNVQFKKVVNHNIALEKSFNRLMDNLKKSQAIFDGYNRRQLQASFNEISINMSGYSDEIMKAIAKRLGIDLTTVTVSGIKKQLMRSLYAYLEVVRVSDPNKTFTRLINGKAKYDIDKVFHIEKVIAPFRSIGDPVVSQIIDKVEELLIKGESKTFSREIEALQDTLANRIKDMDQELYIGKVSEWEVNHTAQKQKNIFNHVLDDNSGKWFTNKLFHRSMFERKLYPVNFNVDLHKNKLLQDSTFVTFDLETTGTNMTDQIIQVAAYKYKYVNGKLTKIDDGFEHYVKLEDDVVLSDVVQKLTRINPDTLLNQGIDMKEALGRLHHYIGSDSVLVAHNSSFDFNMLTTHYNKHFGNRYQLTNPVIDTMSLAFHYEDVDQLSTSFKLGKVAERLGIKLDNAHDARYDTQATAEVFGKLLDIAKKKEKDVNTLGDLNKRNISQLILDKEAGKILGKLKNHIDRIKLEELNLSYYDEFISNHFRHLNFKVERPEDIVDLLQNLEDLADDLDRALRKEYVTDEWRYINQKEISQSRINLEQLKELVDNSYSDVKTAYDKMINNIEDYTNLLGKKTPLAYVQYNSYAVKLEILGAIRNGRGLNKVRDMLYQENLNLMSDQEKLLAEVLNRQSKNPSIIQIKDVLNDINEHVEYIEHLLQYLHRNNLQSKASTMFDFMDDLDAIVKKQTFKNARDLRIAINSTIEKYGKLIPSDIVNDIYGRLIHNFENGGKLMFDPSSTITNDLYHNFKDTILDTLRVVFPDQVKVNDASKHIEIEQVEQYKYYKDIIMDAINDIRTPLRNVKAKNRKLHLNMVNMNQFRYVTNMYEKDLITQNSLYTLVYTKAVKEDMKIKDVLYKFHGDLMPPIEGNSKALPFVWSQNTKLYSIYNFLANDLGINVEDFVKFGYKFRENTYNRFIYNELFDEIADHVLIQKVNKIVDKIKKEVTYITDIDELVRRVKATYVDTLYRLYPDIRKQIEHNKIKVVLPMQDYSNIMRYTQSYKQIRQMFETPQEMLNYLKLKDHLIAITFEKGKMVKVKLDNINDIINLDYNMDKRLIELIPIDSFNRLSKRYQKTKLSPKVKKAHDLLVNVIKYPVFFSGQFIFGNTMEGILKNSIKGSDSISAAKATVTAGQYFETWHKVFSEAVMDDEVYRRYGKGSFAKWHEYWFEKHPNRYTDEEKQIIKFVNFYMLSDASQGEFSNFLSAADKGIIGTGKFEKKYRQLGEVPTDAEVEAYLKGEEHYVKATKKYLPEIWLDKLMYNKFTAKFMGVTQRVEAISRLGLYIDAVNNGQTFDEAVELVRKTYFSLSNKSQAELMSEFVIPFIGYPLRNYMFWMEALEQPNTQELVVDIMLSAWGNMELGENDYLDYMYSRGKVPVSSNQLMDAGLSFMDAMSLPGTLAQSSTRRLNPIIKNITEGAKALNSNSSPRWFIPGSQQVEGATHLMKSLTGESKRLDQVLPSIFNRYYQYKDYSRSDIYNHYYQYHGFYNQLYTRNGTSRIQMRYNPANNSTLKYRINDIMWAFK